MKLIFELQVQDTNLDTQLELLRDNLKSIKKELRDVDENSKAFESLANEATQTRIKIAELTNQQKALKKEFAAAQVPTDSLAGLRIEYSKLTEQVTKLTKAQRESAEGQKLISNAATVKSEINSIQESIGNFTGSVGNYKKALLSIFDLVSAGLVTGGIERGIQIIAFAIEGGIKEFSKYEKSLDNLSALTGVVGESLKQFAAEADRLTSIKIGESEIVNTASGIVEAFKLVGGAQPELLKSAESLADVTKQAIVLSAASGDELKPSVEALTTTLGQFQLGASDAARVANELAAGAKAGASEIPDTTKAIKEFGTTAANANVTTTESIALIQTLAEQQLKGAEAGTQLRNILAKLASADVLPKSAIQSLKDADVNINILKDNTLPLEVRLTELGKLSGDTAKLVKVFGLENLNAATILTGSVSKYKDFKNAITGTNEAYTQAEINSNNLSTSYENLQKEGINVLVKGFAALSPLLSAVLTFFAKSIGVVGGFISLIVGLPKFINENKDAFIGLVSGLALLNGQLIFASLNSIRLAAAEKIRVVVTAAVAGAQTLLNAAMNANPIGLLITGVSLLTIGFRSLFNASESVRASINGLSNLASEVFTIIKESLSAFLSGFEKLSNGDISGALNSFGEFIVKSNPIGIALTQGERLRNAFNQGYNNKIQNDGRDKAESERDDRQIKRETLKAEKIKQITDNLSKTEIEAAKKSQKNIEDQIKRINEIQKSIRDFDASTLTNDFDKQATEIESKRAESLAKVSEARELLVKKIADQKGVLTAADRLELDLISEQTASIIAAYEQQQTAVQQNREQALAKQKSDLVALSLELTQLAEQNAQRLVEAEAEILNSDFAESRNELLAVLNERKRALTEQLADGSINQKKFQSEYLSAQEAFNIGTAALERERGEKIKAINDSLEQVRIESAKATLAARLSAIEDETRAEIEAAKKRATQQGGSPDALIETVQLQAIEKRKAAQIDFSNAVFDAETARKNAALEADKAINESDQKLADDKLARLEKEKDFRRQLVDGILDASASISSALVDIDKNRIDNQLKNSTEALDIEFNQKRQAAAGNADALEKIEVQYQARKAAIEKEAAKERKRLAIIEAVINTALSITKALTGAVPPISFILAGIAAVAGAAQVAVINSQKFAAGGMAKFGMFGGRSHAQGGVRGRFDDGTDIEVEKDEVFIILNKRASKQINQLSDFNYSNGGNRFADGGALGFTPQFQTFNDNTQQIAITAQAGFTDEQVAFIAQSVATETSIQTRNAVVTGLDDRNRTAERESVLLENREI